MKDIATKEEEGYVEAHKGDDSAYIPIEIPELPQVPQKKKKKKKLNLESEWIRASLEVLQNQFFENKTEIYFMKVQIGDFMDMMGNNYDNIWYILGIL